MSFEEEEENQSNKSSKSSSSHIDDSSEFDSCESSSTTTSSAAGEAIVEDRVAVGDECVICLDAVGASPVLMLVCAHEFHETCLKAWLANPMHQSCPLCRHSISVELISQIMGIPEADVARAAADALAASRARVVVNINHNADERRFQRRNSDSSSGSDDEDAVRRRMMEDGILMDPPEQPPYVFGICAKFCCCLMIFAAVIYLLSWVL